MKKNNFKGIILTIITLLYTHNSVFAATGTLGEIKHIAIKFIQISVGVIISAIIIFLCLLGYKKFKLPKTFSGNKYSTEDSLASTSTIDDAIEHFIKGAE